MLRVKRAVWVLAVIRIIGVDNSLGMARQHLKQKFKIWVNLSNIIKIY
jgi:hypothetical protein